MQNNQAKCLLIKTKFVYLRQYYKHTHKKVACAVVVRTMSWGTRGKVTKNNRSVLQTCVIFNLNKQTKWQ
jgi:hypothetical protein